MSSPSHLPSVKTEKRATEYSLLSLTRCYPDIEKTGGKEYWASDIITNKVSKGWVTVTLPHR